MIGSLLNQFSDSANVLINFKSFDRFLKNAFESDIILSLKVTIEVLPENYL